jgi:SNF2 family DNA or RNA helicase
MQAILAARLLWKSERIQNVLVICPGYLIPNWEREIAYWWPQATDHVWKVDGPRFPAMVASAGGNYIFKLLSYELLRRHVEWTADHAAQHDLVIIDEGQAIKNAGSDTAKAVKNLRGRHNWALTGTPVENHKRNLVSLFDFIRPGTLHKDMSESDMSKKKVPYFLRRRTEEVGLQLPELLDEDLYIDLGARQREAYNQMEAAGVVELTEKGDSVRVTHVFQLIQKLQQLCNFEPISGESAKSEALVHELEEVKESGRKALVFSQFVEEPFGLRRLASVLRGKKFTLIECFGDVPATSRQGLVNRFSSTPGITAMLLNYRTGGVGLNLVAANYVFLFNRWWNPAVEEQALKRAHRIRQSERVFVRRFVCRDTIEERIVQKLAEKRRLVSAIVDDAHVTDHPEQSTGLTEEELFSLFNLQVRPKQQQKPAGPIPLTKLENMTPAQYEALVAAVYEKMGYEVERTGGSGDGGVDLRAKSVTDGGGELLAVQCKHYSGTVGVEVLRELLGAVSADSAYTRGVLVVSSRASADCHAFARDKRLMIIEGPEIQRLAEKYGVAEFFGDSSPA